MQAALRVIPVALTFVLGALPLLAQEVTVTLQNGAVFHGRVVSETDRILDLEVPRGRIRLFKEWILDRRGDGSARSGTRDPDDPVNNPLDSAPRVSSESPARKMARESAEHLKRGASIFKGLTRKSADLNIGTNAEEVANSFCQLVQEGRGAEALEHLADGEALLTNAFPVHTKGISAYTRKMAGRVLIRWFRRLSTDAKLLEFLRPAKFAAKTVLGKPGMDHIEIELFTKDGEPAIYLMGIANGRVVDLSSAPPPFGMAVQAVRARLKAMGDKPWSLLPLLEEALLSVTPKMPADDNGPDAKTWSLRPRDKGYFIILPWSYEPIHDDAETSNLDVYVHAPAVRCAAATTSEELAIPLDELKTAFLANVKAAFPSATVVKDEVGSFDDAPIARLSIEVKTDEFQLRYEVGLFVDNGRAFQVGAWCEASDAGSAAAEMEAVFKGLRLGPG